MADYDVTEDNADRRVPVTVRVAGAFWLIAGAHTLAGALAVAGWGISWYAGARDVVARVNALCVFGFFVTILGVLAVGFLLAGRHALRGRWLNATGNAAASFAFGLTFYALAGWFYDLLGWPVAVGAFTTEELLILGGLNTGGALLMLGGAFALFGRVGARPGVNGRGGRGDR